MKKSVEITSKILVFMTFFCYLSLPSEAFLWWSNKEETSFESKEVIVTQSIPFSLEDFSASEKVASITIETLPQEKFGMLMLQDKPVQGKQVIAVTSLPDLFFKAKSTLGSTNFAYSSTYFDGSTTPQSTITLDVIDKPNLPPIAENMELFTYKNIAITCYFDVSDPENDFLTFQILEPPARGSVTISDNGSSSFLYTPYENKTGKDEFTFVVTDSSGNTSNEATVSVEIKKADTSVSYYGDMTEHSAHKSAISLAESGILVGECVGGTYLFHPEQLVTREEFLSLAMAVVKLDPLSDITTTGFYDDHAISTWSKGYVSSALLVGVIQGDNDSEGKPVFNGDSVITLGEASVILDNLLDTTQVSEVSSYHWASQSAANLTAVGVSTSTSQPLPASMNRGEVAELLDSALALMKQKEDNWLIW